MLKEARKIQDAAHFKFRDRIPYDKIREGPEVQTLRDRKERIPAHVKKPGCPARPSSVAVLLRRAEKSGCPPKGRALPNGGDEWPKWLFL